MLDIDYGGWLTENLRDHYKWLLKERDRVELYTERSQLNREALTVMTEIQKRKDDDE